MTNEEFVRRFSILYNELRNLRKNTDYIINKPQLDKLTAIAEFFRDAAKKQGGKVKFEKLEPRDERGGVTAEFVVFDVHGEDVQRFCEVMKACSAIGIDAKTTGEVCIGCTVPNVFILK